MKLPSASITTRDDLYQPGSAQGCTYTVRFELVVCFALLCASYDGLTWYRSLLAIFAWRVRVDQVRVELARSLLRVRVSIFLIQSAYESFWTLWRWLVIAWFRLMSGVSAFISLLSIEFIAKDVFFAARVVCYPRALSTIVLAQVKSWIVWWVFGLFHW